MTQYSSYSLSLADDTQLTLVGADEQSAIFLKLLADAARLKPGDGSGQRMTISTSGDFMLVETVDGSLYRFNLAQDGMVNPLCLFGLTHVIIQQTHSGILLHGALAEYKSHGFLLIAQGGTGKTTASNRLPSPWRSLSDDLTLVVRDAHGEFWAHPWPTWSHFYNHGKGGYWDVQRAIPLNAVFHLSRAEKDRTEPLGDAESIILLIQSAEQAFFLAKNAFDAEFIRRLRLRKFEQFNTLAHSVPVARLYLSLTGSFWNVMEEMVDCPWATNRISL